MKRFEELELPDHDSLFRIWDGAPTVDIGLASIAHAVARKVYDQMCDHVRLAEADPFPDPCWEPPQPKPEELFEHPDMPGKKFRRLKVGERIQQVDWTNAKANPTHAGWVKTFCNGELVESGDVNYYYREVPQPAPEWRLPDPPPGQQWHRTDWTADMLPGGYRPLLDGEMEQPDDEFRGAASGRWLRIKDTGGEASFKFPHTRTRRPLPAPVEYVPLGPEDVPPGSAVRAAGDTRWRLPLSVNEHTLWVVNEGFPWAYLAKHYEILRPGSLVWEPCKKPKP